MHVKNSALVCLVATLFFCTMGNASGNYVKGSDMADVFDFSVLERSALVSVQPQFVTASDGTQLAYYPFFSDKPLDAIIIFYHGGGIWSSPLYQGMASQLLEHFNIGSCLVDIRGHGNSQGPRGDAPDTEQVWQDITTVIEMVQQKHPKAPLFLAGHSSGAGLILNYSSWKNRKSVDGYLLVAPFLGARAGTNREHTDPSLNFVHKVNLWALIGHGMTRGLFFAHTPAVFFNYPAWLKAKNPHVLDYYTAAMAYATSPSDAKAIFTALDRPYALYIGQQDEQFVPEAVIDYTKLSTQRAVVGIVPEVTHLSILEKAPELLAAAIQKIAEQRN